MARTLMASPLAFNTLLRQLEVAQRQVEDQKTLPPPSTESI